MSEYRLHPSSALQQLFATMSIPHQGQDPAKAKILFVGIDANYAAALSDHPRFFERILEYHEDGVGFWHRYGVHHPFLLPDYPLPRNTGGVPYHRKFSAMGLTAELADEISFVELLDVPTTGRTDPAVFWQLFKPDHARALDEVLSSGSRRLVFLSNSVIGYMNKARKRYGLFSWLPRQCEWGCFHRIGTTEFFKAKHFSAAVSLEELRSMGELVREFCSR